MAIISYVWFLLSLNFIRQSLGLDYSLNSRLPQNVIPESYNLDLSINPNRLDAFEGSVIVSIQFITEADQIVIHAGDNLNITTISIRTIPGLEEIVTSWNDTNNNANFVVIHLNRTLKPSQKCTMKILYSGAYGLRTGIFWKSYLSNRTEEYFVMTHFESNHAREAFPCFDEPALKAEFSVTVRHPAEYTTISNMDVKLPQIMGSKAGWKSTTFNKTPKMSTYLLAILVSKFESINNQNHGSAIYKKFTEVYAKPVNLEKVKPILEAAQKCLVAFEKYLDTEYRLPKMSLAVIPDFWHSGMENWGLITLNEELFILDDTDCDQYCKNSLTSKICHEVAHMWFGNDVTLNWWSNLWIKEGFATYFQQRFLNMMGESDSLESANLMQNFMDFYLSDTENGPITLKVSSGISVDEFFIPKFYMKYKARVRMLKEIVGEETFQKTLRNYIKKYSGKAASAENLLEEFQILTNNEITPKMFSGWLNNYGNAVLNAIQRPNSTIVDLFQTQHPNSRQFDNKWYIPLNWATKSNPNFEDNTALKWMNPDENSTIQLESENDWFIINKGSMGYYYINYDQHNWKKISEALKYDHFSGIDVMTRTQHLFEALSSNYELKSKYKIMLDMLGYLKHEHEILPFVPAFQIFTKINQIADNLKYYDRFERFARSLIDHIVERINPDSINYDYNLPENLILQMGCMMNSEHAHRIQKKLIKNLIRNGVTECSIFTTHPIEACCGLLDGDEEIWNRALQDYPKSPFYAKSNILIKVLTCPKNEALLKRVYNIMIDDKTNGSSMISSLVYARPKNSTYLMDFMIENSQKFIKMYEINELYPLILALITGKKSDTMREIEKRKILYETYRDIFMPFTQKKLKAVLPKLTDGNDDIPLHDVDIWILENLV